MPTKGVAPKQAKPRIRRMLASREPQLVENTKKALLMRGNSTCQLVTNLITDIHRLKKPSSKLLSRKNDIHPFDNEQALEFLCQKNDCSLFGLVSHSKKRPNNLVLGRTYEGHILDMFELGVNHYRGVEDFTGRSKKVGSKPCMLFVGDQWGYEEQFTRLQSLLIDFFRGDKVDKIALKGLDHVMVCTVADSTVLIRHYAITFKRSGSKTPNVDLTPMGPHIDLVLRRTRLASQDLWKASLKQPKQVKPTKIKNISHNSMGDKEGKLHLSRQDLSSMKVKRVKALRETPKRKSESEGEERTPAKKMRA